MSSAFRGMAVLMGLLTGVAGARGQDLLPKHIDANTQKAITADLRTMQASKAETERRMQAQYAQLVREGGEAMKLRMELEAERTHSPAAGASAPVAATTADGSEAKW